MHIRKSGAIYQWFCCPYWFKYDFTVKFSKCVIISQRIRRFTIWTNYELLNFSNDILVLKYEFIYSLTTKYANICKIKF